MPDVILEAADPATRGRLQLYPPGLEQELAVGLLRRSASRHRAETIPLLLVSRRMKNTYNSTGPELSLLKDKGTTNPAFVHSAGPGGAGHRDGEIIEVLSSHGAISRRRRRQ